MEVASRESIDVVALKERLAELNPEALLADGFDAALIGIVRQFDKHLALYDYAECIRVICRDMAPHRFGHLGDDMGYDTLHEMAVEHMEFNVIGSWVGPGTPVFLLPEEDD